MIEPDKNADISLLLSQINKGDMSSQKQLFILVYDQLKEIATQRFLQFSSEHSISPTLLVNELYLKFFAKISEAKEWNGVEHFFRTASLAIRNLILDYARSKRSQRRGGDRIQIALEGIFAPAAQQMTADDAILFEEALQILEKENPDSVSMPPH